MKLSPEQFIEVMKFIRRGGERPPKKMGMKREEFTLIKEMVKQLPERAIRHLNYEKIKEEMEKISVEEVAEKLMMRTLVDRLLRENKEENRGKRYEERRS